MQQMARAIRRNEVKKRIATVWPRKKAMSALFNSSVGTQYICNLNNTRGGREKNSVIR